MKKVLLLSTLSLFCSKLYSQTNYSVPLGIGAAIGAGIVFIPQFKIQTPERAALIGGKVGFAVGLLKEIHDTAPELKMSGGNLFFGAVGGVIGAITVYQVTQAIAKRKAKKKLAIKI